MSSKTNLVQMGRIRQFFSDLSCVASVARQEIGRDFVEGWPIICDEFKALLHPVVLWNEIVENARLRREQIEEIDWMAQAKDNKLEAEEEREDEE